MSRGEERHGPQQRRGTPACRRVVHAGNQLVPAGCGDGVQGNRAHLLERFHGDADVGRNRFERAHRRCAVGAPGLGRVQIARRREPLTEPRFGAANELGARRNAAHERRPLGQTNGQRRAELLTLGMHEHHLDIVLEQDLAEAEALVHPRAAQRGRDQLDARQSLRTGR